MCVPKCMRECVRVFVNVCVCDNKNRPSVYGCGWAVLFRSTFILAPVTLICRKIRDLVCVSPCMCVCMCMCLCVRVCVGDCVYSCVHA